MTIDKLLAPALQKFYNALRNLDGFNRGNNFFDNVGYLDSFFNEYRNVTFSLQHSLAHTEYLETYKKLLPKYFNNKESEWLKETRNKVLKEEPFKLEKQIDITVYSCGSILSLQSNTFTWENDENIEAILESIKSFLFELHESEVHFSAEYVYNESGSRDNIFDKLLPGLTNMYNLLAELNTYVEDQSELTNSLWKKIKEINILHSTKSILLVDDYVYYPLENEFERGCRGELILPQIPIPIENYRRSNGQLFHFENLKKEVKYEADKYDFFIEFIYQYIIIYSMQNYNILPTYLLGFNEGTLLMNSFNGSLRTTLYRKMHEIALKVRENNIDFVFFVTEMLSYSNEEYSKHLEHRERQNFAENTLLCFLMVDKELNQKTVYFEQDKINDFSYVKNQLEECLNNRHMIHAFMKEIISEFQNKKQQK